MPSIDNYKVAEFLFSNVLLVFFLLFLQLESFFFLCYSNIIYIIKSLKVVKFKHNQHLINIRLVNSVYFFMVLLLLYSFKFNVVGFGQLIVLMLLYIWQVAKFSKKMSVVKSNTNIDLVLPSFIFFIFLVLFVDSFLTLFFFIELYGVMYYFFFLTSYNFTTQTILRYKNGLLLLLWNNFLTTIFLSLGCFFLLKNYGSTSFFELSLLQSNYTGTYFFLIGFFWKLGLPVFHFFKLEIYNYLLKENVFFFSMLTTLTNVALFYIIFTNPIVFQSLQFINFFVFFLIFSIVLAITNLKIYSFLKFFAFSSIFTLSTVSVIFLI